MEKKPVNVQIEDISLKNVVFDLQNCAENTIYKIKFKDEIKINVSNNSSFSIIFTRKTIENSPFKLEVCYGAKIIANLKNLNQNNETIEEFAERKKNDIVLKLAFPSKASVLISEITKESGSVLVTVPLIIHDKE